MRYFIGRTVRRLVHLGTGGSVWQYGVVKRASNGHGGAILVQWHKNPFCDDELREMLEEQMEC